MVDVSERAQKILKAIVERYLVDGQPIASSRLAKEQGLTLSASTIRSIMSELEESGYLVSPHTSAGRIPTPRGYRLFVDSLLTVPNLGQEGQDEQLLEGLRGALRGDGQSRVYDNALNAMSRLTSQCSLISLPKYQQETLEHIEFLPLADKRVLVVVVLKGGEVQNRMLTLEKNVSRESLVAAGNYINKHFAGLELAEARSKLSDFLQDDREHLQDEIRQVSELAEQVFDIEQMNDEMVICGQNHLLSLAQDGDISVLEGLFEDFSKKHDILNLLDKCLGASSIQIFIGEESGYQVLQECSVIAAPYSSKNQHLGVLAVIGPTRMDYKRVIPVVDISAKMLTLALNA